MFAYLHVSILLVSALLLTPRATFSLPSNNIEPIDIDRVVLLKASDDLLVLDRAIRGIDFKTMGEVLSPVRIRRYDDAIVETSYSTLSENDFKIQSRIFERIMAEFGVERLERIFSNPVVATFGSKTVDFAQHYRLIIDERSDRNQFISAASSVFGVLEIDVERTSSEYRQRGDLPPGDPLLSSQWHLHRQEEYTARLHEAWYLSNKNDGSNIYIIDSDWDRELDAYGQLSSMDHSDLVNNLCGSEAEVAFSPHNVIVAGTASAVSDNSLGVAGAAYNSCLYATAWRSLSWAANRLQYHVDQYDEIEVILLPWGGPEHWVFEDAMWYAYENNKVITVSAPYADEEEIFPCTIYTLCISATKQDGTVMPNVLQGPWIDMAAPGENIFTTTSASGNLTHSYGSAHGTSVAAAQVAAAAAIIRKIYGSLSNQDIKLILEDTAYNRGTSNPNNWVGWGIIDSYEATLEAIRRNPNMILVEPVIPWSSVHDNKHIFIPFNRTLNLSGTTRLENESWLWVLGTLAGGSEAKIELRGGSEIVWRPGSKNEFHGSIDARGTGSCILAEKGAEVTFGLNATLTFAEGGFIASKGGTYVLPEGTKIVLENTAGPPVILPGSSFLLGQNASITSDRPIELIGTQANPIRFERLGSDSWDRVRLTGNNNHIEWVLFEGGKEQLDISGSSGNVITNSTFRNGFYGMRLTDVSSTVITNNHIHNNGSEGLLIFDTAGSDVEVSRNTIRDNGGPGIGLWNTNLYTFFDNVIEDNNSRGIEIMSGSYLFMNLDEPGQVEPGRNRVSENASHQIFISHSSTAYLAYSGLSSYHGYNSVFHTGGATTDRKYIYNLAVSGPGYDGVPYTIFAHRTFWNSYNPTSSLFTGPVDYSNFLVDDPTGGSGAPSGSTPTRIDTDQDLIDRPPPVVALITAGAAETIAGRFSSAPAAEEALWMKQYIVSIRNMLSDDPEDARNARRLNALYYYQMLDREDRLGEHYNIRAVYREWAQRRGSVPRGVDAYAYMQLAVEAAMVLEVRTAVHERRLEEAEMLLQEYSRYTHNLDHRVALMESGVAALGMRGYQAAALDLLDELRAVEPEEVVAAWYSPPNYDAVERLLRDQMAGGGNAEKFQVVLPVDGDDASAPLVFALEQNYPNPFNPSTNIPFHVAEPALVRIEVYDIAGRRVAVLVDERYDSGSHTARFDGGQLASGVYIVRAVMSAADGPASRQFTRKVTLLN